MIAPENIKDKPLLVISEDRTKEFYVKGRGTILVVNKKDYQGYVFETNDIIIYKTDKYKIKTIEMSSKLMYPPILSDTIGLVVNKL